MIQGYSQTYGSGKDPPKKFQGLMQYRTITYTVPRPYWFQLLTKRMGTLETFLVVKDLVWLDIFSRCWLCLGETAGLGFTPRWVDQLRSGTLDAEARTRFWEPLDQPFMRFILESANPATVPIHSRQGNSARTGLCLRPCPFDKRITGVKVRNLERPDEGMERGENERAEPS